MRIGGHTRAAALALAAVALAGAARAQAPTPAAVRQPHMQQALADLTDANKQLAIATRDKAGHRARAAQLVNQAIGEVRAGMLAAEEQSTHRP